MPKVTSAGVKNSPDAIIRSYLQSLESRWVSKPLTIVSPGAWYETTTLDCKILPNNPKNNPKGFSFGAKWQYSVLVDGARKRFIAYRIPFLEDANFHDDSYTVSHLCHNNACMNPDHHVLEPLDVNKGRNGCPAGQHCHHQKKCLMPGPVYNK